MKTRTIIVAVLALLVATACNGQNVKTLDRASQANNLKSQNMNKSIVIFFSHAGDNYSVGNIEVATRKSWPTTSPKTTVDKLLQLLNGL